jgi:hypothetical protein
MTVSPLLPPGAAAGAAESEATVAELNRMAELALSGLAGATADGGTWQVDHGDLQISPVRHDVP